MMTEQDRVELLALAEILDERKKNYWIISTNLQDHQALLKDAIIEKREYKLYNWETQIIPKYKYILYQGWNWSGKSFTWLYTTVLLALWESWAKYNLPYIWTKQDIWIVTKSWANVTSTIWPYLIWQYSKTWIPKDEIDKVQLDNWILKTIVLKNWNKISIRTYDQGYERLMGWNPDFILIDEEPTNKMVWEEILARGRKLHTQIVLTMTPLHWLTPVYSYFYEQENEEVKKISKVILVSSLENVYADHTWLLWLSEQDRKMRIYWQFVPPSWLVYSSFDRNKNVVSHFHPKELGEGVRYFWALDFWHTHPTAFLFIGLDLDWNLYIFDMVYESKLLIKEIAELILKKKREYGIEFDYIVADSAAKRDRVEIAEHWIKTQGADKWTKGETWESNRSAWIFKVNQLLADTKLFISDKCKDLITEFEQHHYKEKTLKDWEVEKTQDDALDALRYFIFSYKVKDTKQILKENFKNKYWIVHNKYNYYEEANNPY